MPIGIRMDPPHCSHLEVRPSKHPAVWVCDYCGEPFIQKVHWDQEWHKTNDLTTELQGWLSLGIKQGLHGRVLYNRVMYLLNTYKVTPMKCYIAGGWFNPDQEKRLNEIKRALEDLTTIQPYFPKDEMEYVPGADISAKEVLDSNILEIESCKFVIASTEGKDMGTLFECGYAYSLGIPVIYYFPHEFKFNLMLGASGHAVITSWMDLREYLLVIHATGNLPERREYTGDME